MAVAPLSLSPSRMAPASCSACQITAAAIAPARICRMETGVAIRILNATMNSVTFSAMASVAAAARTLTLTALAP